MIDKALENDWKQKTERLQLLIKLYYQTGDEKYHEEAKLLQLDQTEIEKKIARSI